MGSDDTRLPQRISDAILEMCERRGPEKTICPSEVARRIADEDQWRDLMDEVRAVAAQLAQDGSIQVTQQGEVVDIATARGPIRLRITGSS